MCTIYKKVYLNHWLAWCFECIALMFYPEAIASACILYILISFSSYRVHVVCQSFRWIEVIRKLKIVRIFHKFSWLSSILLSLKSVITWNWKTFRILSYFVVRKYISFDSNKITNSCKVQIKVNLNFLISFYRIDVFDLMCDSVWLQNKTVRRPTKLSKNAKNVLNFHVILILFTIMMNRFIFCRFSSFFHLRTKALTIYFFYLLSVMHHIITVCWSDWCSNILNFFFLKK